MKFKKEKTSRYKMFFLGKDLNTDDYIMAITICDVVWYEQYFRITKQELDIYDKSLEEFMNIYEECAALGTKSTRFLCSDKIIENTPEQLERLREGN
jgi:hypothetical protein